MLLATHLLLCGLALLASAAAQSTYLDDLVTTLTDANLTTLASLAQNNSNFVTLLEGAGNKTLLAPTNEALEVVADAPSSLLEATLQYHIINSTVRVADVSPDTNTVASTLLTLEQYVTLPGGRAQSIVLRKNGTVPYVAGAKDSSFVGAEDGPQYENVLIQPILAVAFIPSNLSATLTAIGASTFLQALNLTGQLDALLANRDGLTVFAPTNAAMDRDGQRLAVLSAGERVNIVKNHILTGTLLYSTQLSGSNAIEHSTTASGEPVHFDTGLRVTSANVTAHMTHPDLLFSNGVLHLVDTVLLNTAAGGTGSNAAGSAFNSATGLISASLGFIGHLSLAALVL